MHEPFMINMDIDPDVHPNVVADVEKMPFKDNTFSYVKMASILEHVDCFKAMKEVHRVCKDGAVVEIWMPHFSSVATWAHIQHKRGGAYSLFNPGKEKEYGFHFKVITRRLQFFGYSRSKDRKEFLNTLPIHKRLVFEFFDWAINAYPNSFERLWWPYVGGCEGIYFKLRVVK